MDIIVCDISAWEYWRTPPILGGVDIPCADVPCLATTGPSGQPASVDTATMLHERINRREAEKLVAPRLLGELKGISLPVHVMVDDASSMYRSKLIYPHRIPKTLPSEQVISLGGGLSVLSPELTIAAQCQRRSPVQIAKMVFEACGLFSLCPQNERIDFTLRKLLELGIISKSSFSSAPAIYGYSDQNGKRLSFLDNEGDLLPWIPCFDRSGRVTDMWKRPPLSNVDLMHDVANPLQGIRGIEQARRAIEMSLDGAASPEEVKACLLLCSGTKNGGESWGSPHLNRQIAYGDEARALSHRQFAVADMLWPETKGDLEINGEAFHADDLGFRLESGRRAALECMGYAVQEINHEQMADLELFDAILPTMAKVLGQQLHEKTPAFLARRDQLHHALFSQPYEPVWACKQQLSGVRRRSS